MTRVKVEASKTYDIIIGENLLQDAGSYIQEVFSGKTVVVVSDDKVFPLHGATLVDSLTGAGYRVITFIFPNGEQSKSAETYLALLRFMAENQVTRSDLCVALGGGVVGDLTGFAAATFLRGIDFIQIPTTVLAATDSSVGGKTAIDIPEGKNLVGAFYQPRMVLCDMKTLDTLDEQVFWDGCAEIIKYGLIWDKELYEWLKSPIRPQLARVIERCVSIKRDIVNQDETDLGVRGLLNFGHTIGHAVEASSNFTVSHGQAVGIGMVAMVRAMERLGMCSGVTSAEVEAMVKAYHLPTKTDTSVEVLYQSMTKDKKRSGDRISLVVLDEIGKSRFWKIPVQSDTELDLMRILKEGVEG